MKTFEDGAPVRLVLPWMPPVQYKEPRDWASVLSDDVDTWEVREVLGHFDRYQITSDEIHFFMHTKRRKAEVKKMMRQDDGWRRFAKAHPDLRVEWAEDASGDTQ